MNERFWKFHYANPQVYRQFERLALRMRDEFGFRTYSARTIIHLIRFHTDVKTKDPNGTRFKICDHHSPRYGLLLVARRPDFHGFFSTRGVEMDIPLAETNAPLVEQDQGSLFTPAVGKVR